MTYVGTALAQQTPAPKEQKRTENGRPLTGTEFACCEKAVRVHCVCQVSWKCPDHGSWCYGSHE